MLRKIFSTLLIIAIVGGAAVWGYFAVTNKQININNFFTGGYTMGVDVSSYQNEVDFNKLREQGVEFAYIKATEGDTHIDKSFVDKWAAAREAGVPAGAYHYFSYGVSGTAQAQNFIETVGELETGCLIPAVDMELTVEEVYNPPEKSAVVTGLKAFLAVLEERYGVKPLIYAQRDYYEKYLKDDFGDYPRWARNVFYPVWVDAGDDWAVWQYSDRGQLEGYSGEKYIDLNVVNSKKGLSSLMITKK